jgi:glycosyltransferase involved in cell wall biosynthesis
VGVEVGITASQCGGAEDPLVSVVIPCFNAARTLPRTLECLRKQTYPNLEILIVDDGSTDSTPDITANFAAGDRRVHLLSQTNSGVAAARNLGIACARGDFIAPLDADDLWSPLKIELQVRKFQEDASLGLVYAWFENINDKDEIIPGGTRSSLEGHVLRDLCAFDFVGNGSNAMMRTSAIRHVGAYDTSLRARNGEGCEDWKIALRLAETCKFGVVPRILVGYRHSAGNMSDRVTTMIRSARLVAEEYSTRYPELAEILHRHIGDRLFTNAVRCLKQGRWKEALALMPRLPSYGLAWNFGKVAQTSTAFAKGGLRRLGVLFVRGTMRKVRRKFDQCPVGLDGL